LSFVGGARLHGRGLLGFCGYGQVLPAIQHSKNRAYNINHKRDELFFMADYLESTYK
jgi:hypothetical protein